MEQESKMKQAVSAYLGAFLRSVSLEGYADEEKGELAKMFGAFCSRLVTLAERMEGTPHEKAMEYAVRLTETALQHNGHILLSTFDCKTAEAIGNFVTTLAAGLEHGVGGRSPFSRNW